jgi:hypothetical protein
MMETKDPGGQVRLRVVLSQANLVWDELEFEDSTNIDKRKNINISDQNLYTVPGTCLHCSVVPLQLTVLWDGRI